MPYIRALFVVVFILINASVPAMHNPILAYLHAKTKHPALTNLKQSNQPPLLEKYGVMSPGNSNFSNEVRTYFNNFDFESYNNQLNPRLSSKGANIYYSLSSSFFTTMKVGVSQHILNKQDMALEPSVGIGFYFKIPKMPLPKNNNHLFAQRHLH